MYFKNDFFNADFYQRLHTVATVLERFVARAPQPVRLAQLFNDIEMTAPEIRKICSSLRKIGLINAAEDPDQWVLVGHPAAITLEDVWRSVMLDEKTVRKSVIAGGGREPADDIDLLIAQALLAINQSISTHLRKCQLDRVKVSQCGFISSRCG